MPRSWPHSKPLLAVTHSWANPGESRCGNSVAGPIFFSQPCGQQALSDGLWRGASSSGQEACISPAPAAAPPALPCPALPEGPERSGSGLCEGGSVRGPRPALRRKGGKEAALRPRLGACGVPAAGARPGPAQRRSRPWWSPCRPPAGPGPLPCEGRSPAAGGGRGDRAVK